MKYTILAIFAGILIFVSLPVGIIFFIILAYFYLKSALKEEVRKEIIPDEPKMEYPDIHKELNNTKYQQIQEANR